MNLSYGWGLKHDRVTEYIKGQTRNKVSLLMAISYENIISWKIYNTSINSEYYSDFIKNLNCQNKILIMDNVKFHKSKKVKDSASFKNNEIIFIPPYSPQYNPIEEVFSKIKHVYKKLCYTQLNVHNKILKSINSITSNNLKKYYEHSFIDLIKI